MHVSLHSSRVTCSLYSFKACVNGVTKARELFGHLQIHKEEGLPTRLTALAERLPDSFPGTQKAMNCFRVWVGDSTSFRNLTTMLYQNTILCDIHSFMGNKNRTSLVLSNDSGWTWYTNHRDGSRSLWEFDACHSKPILKTKLILPCA